jgi:hypothetical protein
MDYGHEEERGSYEIWQKPLRQWKDLDFFFQGKPVFNLDKSNPDPGDHFEVTG